MIQKIVILILCYGLLNSVISSEWLAAAKKAGYFFSVENEIETIRSDQCSFSAQVKGGKWLNNYFDVYIGVQQSFSRLSENSFTGVLFGTELTLLDIERLALNVNVESQAGSDATMFFSPGVELSYRIKSVVPSYLLFSINEVLGKRDTSWAKDDTGTLIVESHAGKMYTLQTELKMGYSRKFVQNQYLQITVNPVIHNNPVQGENVVDPGSVSFGYRYYFNNHLQIASEFNILISHIGETVTFGFKISLITY